MATSSRQTALFGLQDWKRIYQTFREADFQSYDFETLRKSFIDYLSTYYPETFNDYIESSEFVALLDVMAFMGQAMAFRDDLNTRENFIDTAERRDSVIKLANLVSYTPKRNLCAQGLVKITAISTTENITDINGNSLNNITVFWNDPANANWQEQFNTIINSALVNSQRVGRPGNSQTILGVKTDEYTMNIPAGQLPVVPYITEVDNINMNFELVSATSLDRTYLYELPPAPSSQFNVLYRNDKLGFGSANTGFFFYFKQGTLQNFDFNFAERIENNFQLIPINGINNTDTWLYQLSPTGAIENEWIVTDNVYINANLQGDSQTRIFSVTSQANDQVTYVFGDGVFGEVPVGAFRSYVRSSNALTYTIDPSEMNGIVANIPYISRQNRLENLTVTFSLQTTVTNAQQRESLAQIKERAPSRYYTQNRMVNGEDYTNFPFTQYNSIVKSKAINRSSIGVSRNQDLQDPTGKYSSTNVFGDDGALYASNQSYTTTFSTSSVNIAIEFLSQDLPVLLNTPGVLQYYHQQGTRYAGNYPTSSMSDGYVYWNKTTVADTNTTGYFYVKATDGTTTNIPVGSFSSYDLKYISKGALLKFVPAPGYTCFDKNNRMKTTAYNPAAGDKLFIWVGVLNLVGDGNNYGEGNLSNGSGPVALNDYIPQGAVLDNSTSVPSAIIPSFDNTLSNDFVRKVLALIELKTPTISLYYDNSVVNPQERWYTSSQGPDSLLMAQFNYNSTDLNYIVSFDQLTYFFGSVAQVRFLFDGTQRVFDPQSGQTIRDFINIFRTNSNSAGTGVLGSDYILYITGQQIQTDGYPDDLAVQVSSINVDTNFTFDPDFFQTLTGSSPILVTPPASPYVFFRVLDNINDLYRFQLLPNDAINTAYSTQSAILDIIYEYPAGTIFYATSENDFYQTQEVPGSVPTVIQLNDVTSSYSVTTGRGALNFQYRHNSNNTTRIDPATTNIIDLYLVTQSYYTAYQNWLRDTTGAVPLPDKPTITELQQAYGGLDSYKMISDSIVPNSVSFKPLFGTKAMPALQGTIKVIKSPATTASDSQIRSSVLSALNSYFTIDKWDFGDTFYMSELTAYLHVQLAGLISSVVLVPADPNQTFGDLYEIRSAPNEIFVNGATTNDIIVISALTPQALQR
jgi:hypothetical protein